MPIGEYLSGKSVAKLLEIRHFIRAINSDVLIYENINNLKLQILQAVNSLPLPNKLSITHYPSSSKIRLKFVILMLIDYTKIMTIKY